jgi:hypothetical protein
VEFRLATGAVTRGMKRSCVQRMRVLTLLLPNLCALCAGGPRVHKETLSPLDATVYTGRERPGQHPDIKVESAASFGGLKATSKPSPKGACWCSCN